MIILHSFIRSSDGVCCDGLVKVESAAILVCAGNKFNPNIREDLRSNSRHRRDIGATRQRINAERTNSPMDDQVGQDTVALLHCGPADAL
jgi:hypothetical protein